MNEELYRLWEMFLREPGSTPDRALAMARTALRHLLASDVLGEPAPASAPDPATQSLTGDAVNPYLTSTWPPHAGMYQQLLREQLINVRPSSQWETQEWLPSPSQPREVLRRDGARPVEPLSSVMNSEVLEAQVSESLSRVPPSDSARFIPPISGQEASTEFMFLGERSSMYSLRDVAEGILPIRASETPPTGGSTPARESKSLPLLMRKASKRSKLSALTFGPSTSGAVPTPALASLRSTPPLVLRGRRFYSMPMYSEEKVEVELTDTVQTVLDFLHENYGMPTNDRSLIECCWDMVDAVQASGEPLLFNIPRIE